MASETGNKRSRPIPSKSQRSQKRQRIELKSTQKKKGQKKTAIAVDSLPWNESQLPDMFDDAEGFFGLEEVEGVEIVREGNNVQFMSSSRAAPIYESDFEGFGDDDNEAPEVLNREVQHKEPKSKKKNQPKTIEKVKKDDAKVKTTTNFIKEGLSDSDLQEGVFPALTGESAEDGTDVSAWAGLCLSHQTLCSISRLGFSRPTAIQAASIPEILKGHDVIGKASTGSGKTLAFGIPILETWLERQITKEGGQKGLKLANDEIENKFRAPTALILSPTRELAHQISEHLKAMCSGLPDGPKPYIATVVGGLSVQKQQRQLRNADIIIGTPGRLWDVMASVIDLTNSIRQIQILVVDEADRLLSEGSFKEAEEIIAALDRQADESNETENTLSPRQTLVFSATLHKDLQQKLAGRGKYSVSHNDGSMEYLLKKLNFREDTPRFIDVNPISQMAENVKEGMVECAGTEKDLYLYSLLMYHPNQRTLIFTNSIHSVRRLTPLLQKLNLKAQSLHSQMIQRARLRSIENFASPQNASSILVATDVAARGLDITGVQLVIHYHLPRTADMYVHRSGRTARASASGSSILLCSPEEVVGMRRLVAKVHAQNAITGGGSKSKYYMRSLDLDRKVVARLKPRVTLAKKIVDSALAKEKKGHDDEWVRAAAEELGVDYDSEEFEAGAGMRKGRGTGRKLKEKEARQMTKSELGALNAELKGLLGQRVNVGVSERYLTSGPVNIEQLLSGVKGEFLGSLDGIGMDD